LTALLAHETRTLSAFAHDKLHAAMQARTCNPVIEIGWMVVVS